MKSKRFDFGCLMGNVQIKNWDKLFEKFIEPGDVYGTQEEGFGVEKKPHVTLMFGFHDDIPGIVNRLKKELPCGGAIKIKLKAIGFFETPDYDVVKFDVESPELTKLNKWCRSEFEHTDSYKDYYPHATIAYVKKGKGKEYKRKLNKQCEVEITELIYSHPGKSLKTEHWSIAKNESN